MPWTLFDYLYRDAGNFKAFGCVALAGRINSAERETILEKLESGEYFIAEQVSVPPLYEQLYRWSEGPVEMDHCWHEFGGFREVDARPTDVAEGGIVANSVRRFASVEEWNLSLSPHAELA